jgi:hypothetical protein
MGTAAIQRALDLAAKGGGVVLVPEGRFLTGTLHLPSHVEVRLAKGAVLLGSAHRHDYTKGVWYALLVAKDAEDVAIDGEGTIDGQGAALAQDVLHLVDTGEVKIPPKGWRPSELDRPIIIEATNCHAVRVEGVTLKNSVCWVQKYQNCVGLTIRGIKVDSKSYWNNDGIDIVDCRNVRVSDCDFDCADDGICLKSDTPGARCEDVTVGNCRVRSSASAIKFGTSSHGGFRRVRISGIRIRDTFRSCVALESVDGGDLEDVVVENVRATHTGNAFFIRLGHRNTKAPPGKVRHIVLRDFDVQIPAGRPDMGYRFEGPQFREPHNLEPASIAGLPQATIEDVRLEHIRIRFPGGGNAGIAYVPIGGLGKVPERPTEYPEFTMFGELPAWALYARHVRGIYLKDFTVGRDATDYRPAFVFDDVSNVLTENLTVTGADRSPRAVMRKVHRARLPRTVRATIVR